MILFIYSRIFTDITHIGRGNNVDIFLDSNIRKGLISRSHAKIIKNTKDGEVIFEIYDSSTNGTYVNDIKVNKSVTVKEGDKIAFGHLRGSLIKPGEIAPQKESEFIFMVCLDHFLFSYLDVCNLKNY